MTDPLTQIDLKIKLPDVKKAKDGNDVFICPETWADTINNFFLAHEIPFTEIENPKLYPIKDIDRQLAKTIEPCWYPKDLNELRDLYGVTAFISEFDADALFDWAIQLFAMDPDPAYEEYLKEEDRKAHDYYEQNIKPWE